MPTIADQVGAGIDDARDTQSQSNFTHTSGRCQVTRSDDPSLAWDSGFIFRAVSAPQGSTVNASSAQFYAFSDAAKAFFGEFYFEAADSPADFSASSTLDRAKTASSVSHEESDVVATAPDWWTTPDLSAPAQEVIDSAGFNEEMNLLAFGKSTAGGQTIFIRAYDGDSSKAAKFDMTYTEAAAGGAAERSYPRGVARGVTRGVA